MDSKANTRKSTAKRLALKIPKVEEIATMNSKGSMAPPTPSVNQHMKNIFAKEEDEGLKMSLVTTIVVKAEGNDDEAETEPLALGNGRYVTIRRYKGKVYVNIREMDGEKPNLTFTRKGINLRMEEWLVFMNNMSDLNDCIERLKEPQVFQDTQVFEDTQPL
jgi:hypothetical protein